MQGGDIALSSENYEIGRTRVPPGKSGRRQSLPTAKDAGVAQR